MTLMPSLGMYCSERSWNMTFDLRRTVFSKLARRRMCNCSFDSSKCASKESWGVGVEHISRSKRANSCTFFLSALKKLAFALINFSKWIFIWENVFLYWHTSWSWPTKKIFTFLLVLPRKKEMFFECVFCHVGAEQSLPFMIYLRSCTLMTFTAAAVTFVLKSTYSLQATSLMHASNQVYR